MERTHVSFDALNLWASKRGFEISQNRIETQNPCLSNLWGHGFVIQNTVVAGCRLSLLARQLLGSNALRLVGTADRVIDDGVGDFAQVFALIIGKIAILPQQIIVQGILK